MYRSSSLHADLPHLLLPFCFSTPVTVRTNSGIRRSIRLPGACCPWSLLDPPHLDARTTSPGATAVPRRLRDPLLVPPWIREEGMCRFLRNGCMVSSRYTGNGSSTRPNNHKTSLGHFSWRTNRKIGILIV